MSGAPKTNDRRGARLAAGSRSRIWTIYRKEVVDTLRDRRTLATMLLAPMVGYPLALLAASETISIHQRAGEAREVHVVVGVPLPPPAIERLRATPRFVVRLETETATAGGDLSATSTETSSAALAARARHILTESVADVVILAAPDAKRRLDGQATAAVTLFYDAAESWADAAVARVEDVFSSYAIALRDERMRRLGAPPSTAEPLTLTRRSVATNEELGNQLASTTLPALVLLFIAISSFYPAVDLTAGEKERKTLATLLTAPVHPRDIVLGKYLAVVTVGTLAGLLNVLVLGVTLLRVFAADPSHKGAALAFAPHTWIALVFSVLLIALPIGALMLTTASLARSFRDASNLLTPVLLLSTTPAVLSSLPGFEISPLTAAIPLANAALFMKALILRRASLGVAAIVVVSSLAATAAILALAARVFTDERVLFSTEGRRADLRAIVTAPPALGLSTALVFASVVFVGNYYGGLAGKEGELARTVVVTQVIAHVLPSLGFAWWLRVRSPPSLTLGLGAPSLGHLFGGLLVGLGGWLGLSLPAGWLTSLVVPGQEEAARLFRQLLGLDALGLGPSLLVLALLPAFAEELAFRGVLLGLFLGGRGSRRASLGDPRAAVGPIVAQALVFGLMHGSVFRLLPTGLLGLVLGVLAVRTGSIWPGVLAHALTNGIILLIDRSGGGPILDAVASPTPLAFLGLALVSAGLWLVRPSRETPISPEGPTPQGIV